MLFKQLDVKGAKFAEYSESEYKFICRWDSPYGVALRDLLNGWFSYYPTEKREQFKGRFCSERTGDHYGAFFELYLFHLFRSCGYRVDVEPKLGWTNGNPDFLLTGIDGSQFIVEAINLTARDDDPLANDILDRLNKLLPCGDFFLCVPEIRGLERTVRLERLAEAVTAWLATLDPDCHDENYVRRFRLHESSWIELHAIPRSAGYRGTPARIVASMPGKFHCGGAATEIRAALEKKAKPLLKSPLPVILALNSQLWYGHLHNYAEALFGVNPESGYTEGAFFGSLQTPHKRSVSAVLAFNKLSHASIATAVPTLHLHHSALRPIIPNFLPPSICSGHADAEQTLRDLIGLPNDWPSPWP